MKTLIATLALTIPAAAWVQQDDRFAPLQRGEAPRRLQSPPADGGKVLPLDECRLELLPSRIIMIGASQTGVLEYVEPGEIGKEVAAKAIVAKIRDSVMQAKLKAAIERVKSDIEIRYAEASNAVAEDRYRQALTKKSSYSPAEITNLKLEFKKTQLQIEKARVDRDIQRLEQDEINAELENYSMTSPISGEVAQVLKKTGESVRQGEDIMQVIDTSEIQAIGAVPARAMEQVAKGTRVRLYLTGPSPNEPAPFDDVFEGKITFLEKRVNRVSQTLDVYATVVNKKDRNGNFILRQGMSCRMEVLLGSHPAPRERR